MPGVKIDWGHDREEPEGVKIQLTYVGPGMLPDERFVRFYVGDEEYGGWMPDYSVNEAEKWLKAFIVADFDDGRWLVRLPEETLSSGPNIFIPREYQDIVLQGWW